MRMNVQPSCGAWLVAAAGIAFAPSLASAGFITVDPGGTGNALTIQGAMLLASSGDTVAVIQGTHTVANQEVVAGVALLGGWNASFTARTPGTSELQANAQRALQCRLGQGSSTVIDGFEITGATGSAIECDNSSPTITNNEIHGNSGQDGAGIHCLNGASPLIENNHIHHNSATYGGGIRAHFGFGNSPTIRLNLVEYNDAFTAGGGIGVNNGSPIIEDNVVRFNTATGGGGSTGGGIHVWHAQGGTVTVRRNLVIYNTASEGGGIGITGGHPIIENNTLWGNSAPEGGCIYQEESGLPDPGTTYIRRNILGGAPVGGAVFCITDYSMSLDCNCIWNNAGPDYSGCAGGGGDIFVFPAFCGVTMGDFTLATNSPCAATGPSGCGLIGAYGVGCGPVTIEGLSWGQIKAGYR